MGGLCGGSRRSRATRRTPRERARRMTGAEEAVRRGRVTPRTGLRAVASDIAMDTGLQKPDTEYYSRLRERGERSRAALESRRSRRRRSRDRRRERAAQAAAAAGGGAEGAGGAGTGSGVDSDGITTPTPPGPPTSFSEAVDTGGDTTYKGGDVSVGDVVDGRVVTSETEAEAIESTGGGRVSTIATSPKGLLGTGEAGTVRRRRSLMGGGLIR